MTCWCFALLPSSMWLIHIDKIGWLLLVQSHALVATNHRCRCCSLLQHNIAGHHCVNDVVIPRLSLAPVMRPRGLVGCCLGRYCIPLLQSIVVCCHSMQYNVKRYARCHYPCNWQCFLLSSLQPTAYIIFDCCILASCDGVITLLTPLQYNCFLQHQKCSCHSFSCNMTLKICSLLLPLALDSI